jgi:hypothetical protein
MLLGIDRVIVPIAEEDRDSLSAQLEEAGLVYVGDTGLPDHPSADAHFALEGGGFVELVWERAPGSSPFRTLFTGMPRVAGLGFTSPDFDRDRLHFEQEPDAWHWRRENDDGSVAESAGPATVGEEDPYLFLISAPRLPYDDSGATGRLTEVLITGSGAADRLDRYAKALAVAVEDGSFQVGETRVAFSSDDVPGVTNSLVIAGAKVDRTLELARGRITFTTAD